MIGHATGTRRSADRVGAGHDPTGRPWQRLTATDLINLNVETPTAPTRVGAVAVLDGRALLDSAGRLRLGEVRGTIDRRLDRVPRLRQVIHRAGPLSGGPVWVDDATFRVDRHVHQVDLPPGVPLLDLATRLVAGPLDHRYPLWRMWFVTGLPDGRVALVFGMHHVVADGITTIRLIGALMDSGAQAAREPHRPWTARPAPTRGALVRDSLQATLAGVRRLRHLPAALPGQVLMLVRTRGAPRTSLNHPVGARRRLAAVTVDLEAAREVAHRHHAKINDLVLALAAGGIRALLRSRSEPADGLRLHVSVAVSLRPTTAQADVGNRSGGIVVRVPLDPDPHRRLREIARDSARAKQHQLPTTGNSLLVWLARVGLLRHVSRHQRMVNVVESNVAGPTGTITLLGAPVVAIFPIGTLVGNLSLGFLALSYAGRLTIAVQADADRYPDLPVLIAAMHRDYAALRAAGPRGTALGAPPRPGWRFAATVC